jgi:EmrB/QacA subfamily drug resistance transporter
LWLPGNSFRLEVISSQNNQGLPSGHRRQLGTIVRCLFRRDMRSSGGIFQFRPEETMMQTKKGLFLIVLSVAFASFMVRLNNYTVNVSLPSIAEHLDIGTGQVSRIVMSYLLIITSTLLLFGKLGDRIGLKKVFLCGYTVFVVGSLACGLSSGIHMLIGSRVIQGIGGSMLLATSFAIISRYLPADRTGWAFGITSTASSLGVATGAPLGGVITGYLSWHWIFFINVPVGIVALWVAARNIPGEPKLEKTPEGAVEKEKFDLAGAVLSFFGLALLLYGFNGGKEMGWGSPVIILSFALSLVLLSLLVFRERRIRSPLLDLTLFRNFTFTFALGGTFMSYLLVSGNAFILPFYLRATKGLNPQQIGLVLLVYSSIFVVMSSRAGKLADKVSPAMLCTIAMVSAAVNTFVFSYTLQLRGLAPVLLFLIWMAISFVIFFSPNNKQVMSCAPKGRTGVASGLFNTTTNLAMVFGVALFEAIFAQFSGNVSVRTFGLPTSLVQQAALFKGFQAVYVCGGIACVGALVFSVLAKMHKRVPSRSRDLPTG